MRILSEPVLIIAGPTASGKSALAVDVALEFGGTVINADSMQVYKELNVLTARPPGADLSRVPHRLYGVQSVAEACSVGRWLDLAVSEVKATWKEHRLPIVVGGTGMYIKALTEGLAPIPDVPEQVRADITARHRALGPEAFHGELAKLDSQAAARIPPGDTQRVIRAVEVATATGKSLSDWQKDHPAAAPLDARFAAIKLVPDRDILYQSVDDRFRAMLDAGAVEEVRALAALGLDPALPAMKAVGVPELLGYLAGDQDLDSATEDAARATRNFAKRQLTWLRNQMAADLEITAQYSESLRPKIFSFIRQFLLTDAS